MSQAWPLNMEKVQDLVNYLHERERIRIKKESGQPKPWTTDEVLLGNRFTNVLRSDDKTTRWLWQNWVKPHYGENPVTEFLNCAIFRWFGTIEFGELLGYSDPVDMERVRLRAREVRTKGHKIFTRAYMITNGGLSGAKEDVVTTEYLTPLQKAAPRLVDIALTTRSWEKVSAEMRKVSGHGGQGFMTKEILADAQETSMFINGLDDKYTWTPMGPGARRGMNRLRDRDADRSMPEKLYLEEVRELYDVIAKLGFEAWMPQPYAGWDLHALQFALCESDKHSRVIDGGRMKNRYNGRK